jgi:hypothetical protein
MPSVRAVCRLMTNSNFTARITGRSAGLTRVVAWRRLPSDGSRSCLDRLALRDSARQHGLAVGPGC